MTDEQKKLAHRAVTCERWRWMTGMRDTEGARVVGQLTNGKQIEW